MSGRLENFIRNNRKEFDIEEPPAGLWDRIEAGLTDYQKKNPRKEWVVRLSFIIRAAAVFFVVLAAGIILFQYSKKETEAVSNINPQLAQQQVYYTALIEEKRNELERIGKDDPALYQEFSSEIKKMDESYQKLKKDLPASPNQEATVRAMIKNLQIQIQVLNQQLQIIEQVNQFKENNHNGTQSI